MNEEKPWFGLDVLIDGEKAASFTACETIDVVDGTNQVRCETYSILKLGGKESPSPEFVTSRVTMPGGTDVLVQGTGCSHGKDEFGDPLVTCNDGQVMLYFEE